MLQINGELLTATRLAASLRISGRKLYRDYGTEMIEAAVDAGYLRPNGVRSVLPQQLPGFTQELLVDTCRINSLPCVFLRAVLFPLFLPHGPQTSIIPHFQRKWAELDSNQRSQRQRIYSPPRLATSVSARKMREASYTCVSLVVQGFSRKFSTTASSSASRRGRREPRLEGQEEAARVGAPWPS